MGEDVLLHLRRGGGGEAETTGRWGRPTRKSRIFK